MEKKLLGLSLLLMITCFSTVTFAETITLKSGKTVEGKITERTDKYIKVDTEGMSLTYYSDEIDNIDGVKFGQSAPQGVKAAGPPQADAIVQNMIASYKKMSSYSSEGTIEDNIKIMGIVQKQTKTISLKLEKPNLYKIEWLGKLPGGLEMKGVVWNAGQGAYLAQSGQYQKYTSDKTALGAATGVSGQGAYVIPALFLGLDANAFKKFGNLKLTGSETIDGQDCYIISGESQVSTQEKFWVTKDKFLIVRRSYTMDKKLEIPTLTDEQLDEAIKGSGLEVNDENREKMRQMMEMSKAAMKSVKMEGSTHQEDYANIVIDQDIAPQEFNNEVPQGVQQNSMSNMFNHLDGVKYSMIAAQGINLTPDEVSSLETALVSKPEDFETRVKLLGYYFAKQIPDAISKKQGHIIWIIKNKPDYPGGELIWPELMLTPQIDGNVYDQVKQLWLGQVQKYPDNAVVLRNAARYFKFSDAALSKELMGKAKVIDPKTVLDEK